jgi:hypothetical protein
MRCCCAIGKAIIIDQSLIILMRNNISIKIIIFGTFEGILNFALSSLKDDLLDVGSLLTLMGILVLCAPSLPSASGIETFSRLVLLVYLLKVACSLFMPKLITVGAFLLEVYAIVCEVTRLPA